MRVLKYVNVFLLKVVIVLVVLVVIAVCTVVLVIALVLVLLPHVIIFPPWHKTLQQHCPFSLLVGFFWGGGFVINWRTQGTFRKYPTFMLLGNIPQTLETPKTLTNQITTHMACESIQIPDCFLDRGSLLPSTAAASAAAAIDVRFQRWDWWDEHSTTLLPGLTNTFPALVAMKTAWKHEPLRSRVLARIHTVVAASTDAHAFPLLFVVSRKCYAQALYHLGNRQEALQVVDDVLAAVPLAAALAAHLTALPLLEVQALQQQLQQQLHGVTTLRTLLLLISS